MSKARGRFAALEAMIPTDTSRLIDVGCDHGLLSRAFLERNPAGRVLAVDKRVGPLAQARVNLAPFLAAGRARLSLSDGLADWLPEAGDCVLIAGLGALEIFAILQRLAARPQSRTEAYYPFVFQAMQDMPLLRRALREQDFACEAQLIAAERGKFYSIDRYRLKPAALAQLSPAAYADRPEDWLGALLWNKSPAFMSRNAPDAAAGYIARQMRSARHELRGLAGRRAEARARLLAEAAHWEERDEA